MKNKQMILNLILPNSPQEQQFQDMASECTPPDNQDPEFIDHEEFGFEEQLNVERSNYDERSLGEYQLGSNSATIDISLGQWV